MEVTIKISILQRKWQI